MTKVDAAGKKGGERKVEMRQLIQDMLERVRLTTMRALDGLSYDELKWRPSPECNSIGFILWHQIRIEDSFIQARAQGKPQIWESENWYQKLNIPLGDSGYGYTAEQIGKFPVPKLKDLLAYAQEVQTRTQDYIKSLDHGDFDHKLVKMPPVGDVPLGKAFALLLPHLAQHAGEMAYVRGLQRGMNK